MPAVSASAKSSPSEGRIQEAVSDYLKGPARTSGADPGRKSQPLFGRRKGDSGSTELPYLHRQYVNSDLHDDLQPQPVLLVEHEMVPLAQVHDSYIVAQSQDGMAIIDQHAAHERVLFEKLQDQFAGGNIPIQDLLIPAQLELGPAQSRLLEEYVPELQRLGFVVEDFGSGVFMIKAIPFLMVGADYKKLLLDILDEVNVHGKSEKLEELRDDILSVMACHPAIKVHRRLDQKEMETLLNSLFQCRMPHTCPHGRPTVVRFSMGEIQKMFKRI
jgi:DNA mismatch repair ATPase MutL